MSADDLRQAANTLRERATEATPGPWEAGERCIWSPTLSPNRTYEVVVDGDAGDGGATRAEDARFIALMHPGVGLALADWLLIQSHHVASHDCEAHCPINGCDETNQALVVARLINGA